MGRSLVVVEKSSFGSNIIGRGQPHGYDDTLSSLFLTAQGRWLYFLPIEVESFLRN
jgi:hypothetical protein